MFALACHLATCLNVRLIPIIPSKITGVVSKMVLDASVRSARLRALRDDPAKIVGKEKLFYKGATERFPVYQIPLELLVYNRHNGRIESEMLTWEFEHDVGEKDYTDEIHHRIETFLWETNVARNEQTLKDLRAKQQQRPGIVSLDGVIIDGNRRAMLLNKIDRNGFFEAVILPDEYYENEKEIVRLETQYQIGEDAKLDYGPLEKYLKVKRLHRVLGYEIPEVAQMMSEGDGEVERLLAIMDLMDDYLEHIRCPNLYNMLKEKDGSTKEGMFVDLFQDLKRLDNGRAQIQWPVDRLDVLELRTIQFDHIRYGNGGGLFESGKDYREISHDSRGEQSFFAYEEIWKKFSETHGRSIDPINTEIGSLDDYIARNPQFGSRVEAAEAREDEWKSKAKDLLKNNFYQSSIKLEAQKDSNEPRKLLERALAALSKVDVDGPGFLSDTTNAGLVKELSSILWDMKKRIDRQPART